MPIYEYQCDKCGVFDVMQRITEKPLKKCPSCKSKVSKLVSNTAFHLKGTGWYVTDYARKSGASEKSAESKSESKAESKSDKGIEKSSSSGSDDGKSTKAKKSKSDSGKAADAA